MLTHSATARRPTVPVLLVRFRAGVVRESQRVVHLVDLPTEGTMPQTLTARCGQSFTPGQAERMAGITGMPCLNCLTSRPPHQPAGSG